jgi:hypothetical protein
MPTKTYEQIAKVELNSDTSGIDFSSIPQTYTDLRVVIQYGYTNAGSALGLRFNDDSGQNYCSRNNFALSNSASYNLKSNFVFGGVNITHTAGTVPYLISIIDIFEYTQTDTFKTYMTRNGNASSTDADTSYGVTHWFKSSKEAVTKISLKESSTGGNGTFGSGNLRAGTVAVLYGIKAGS